MVNDLGKKILEMGDLKLTESKPARGFGGAADDADDFPSRAGGLSRSKSDHRLVAEFRRREEAERSPPARRRFGESRYNRSVRHIYIYIHAYVRMCLQVDFFIQPN